MKGVGGFYYVRDDEGKVYECRAAGKFRKDGMKPLPGDYVLFDPPTGTAAGRVYEIEPRRNELIRPPAANIDMELIVASPKGPAMDFLLVDKLILQARCQGIEPVLCINKADAYQEEARAIAQSYRGACQALCISAKTGEGIESIRELTSGRTVCFAGQSAVGKSTLINSLCGEDQQTGELSAKTERGRHTTRTAELFYSPHMKAYVMDTPGFSVFDGSRVGARNLAAQYSEFEPYVDACRFSSCMHRNEPGCAVREALENGAIDRGRYERYLRLLDEEENQAW